MPQISVRGVEMPESPIRKLAPLAYAAKDRGIRVYHLNIGQPDLPTPKAAIDAIKNIDRQILEYSPSQGYLSYRKKLVGYYGKYNINLTPEDIIITSGGSEAVLFSFLACLNPGDEIIVPEPAYANYMAFAISAGAVIRTITTTIEEGFSLPKVEKFKTQIEMYDCQKGAPAKWRLQNDQQQRPYNDSHVFASAGAGLWTTAHDQYKFYKMLMNLGVGDNGVRILKEETVKSILAVSTRPQGLGGYSLGLSAPETDNENQWFGHGGAWGTNCSVNWHKKQLKLWAVQLCGGPRPWDKEREEASEKFFKSAVDSSGVDAYTGRVK